MQLRAVPLRPVVTRAPDAASAPPESLKFTEDPGRAGATFDNRSHLSKPHARARFVPKPTVEPVSAPDDSLDIASMTREERDALKRRILAQHPNLVEELTS